jgi:glycogen operon protein
MTARHPGVPPELRGTYLGLACEPVIAHLQSLGVTAVELLPIQHAAIERHLVAAGLTNYWGYSTVGFFAPDARWATGALGQQVREFKQMVRSLHAAGLEVILDVAYNHTGEGSEAGATLAFRGLDNRSYYRLLPEDPRRHLDFTGCGNTLDLDQPRVLELVIESLRYWVREMHVDGFRFDLATALARHPIEFRRDAPFFQAIAADPLLSRVKLIAEPWDLGPGGYQLGAFPAGFAEWNGRYRDAVRSFWGGFDAPVGELASRLSGSSDVFQPGGRGPHASVNFVTCHDGFTIADLVSYERKHNEENREENRDGSDYNLSRNFGVEGPSDSPFVRRLRARVQRNFLATLYLSHGVPMLSHGDELGRSQSGNNNAYCLDCETTWIDWQLGPDSEALLAFARELARVRRATPALRREAFFAGVAATSGGKDLAWLRGDGAEMGQADWQDSRRRVLGMLVYPDRQAIPGVEDGSGLLLLVNAGEDAVYFVLPSLEEKGRWREVLHTARPPARTPRPRGVNLIGRSLILLRHEAEPAAPIRTP